MLATVLEWLTDFLTGAIMESRKAARSKAVAGPRWFDSSRGLEYPRIRTVLHSKPWNEGKYMYMYVRHCLKSVLCAEISVNWRLLLNFVI